MNECLVDPQTWSAFGTSAGWETQCLSGTWQNLLFFLIQIASLKCNGQFFSLPCFLFMFLKQALPLSFSGTIDREKWSGEALLPWRYFPQGVDKMNSYAIHGSGESRVYEALYPVPKADLVPDQEPDL